jgi:hypothetical protein
VRSCASIERLPQSPKSPPPKCILSALQGRHALGLTLLCALAPAGIITATAISYGMITSSIVSPRDVTISQVLALAGRHRLLRSMISSMISSMIRSGDQVVAKAAELVCSEWV